MKKNKELPYTICVFGIGKAKMPKTDDIISEVCSYYQVPVDVFYGPSMQHIVTTARHVAVYLIRTLTNQSLRGIGEIINRHPLTVDAAFHKIETQIKNDNALSNAIQEITKRIDLHDAEELGQ